MLDFRNIRRESRSPKCDFLHRLTWGGIIALIILIMPLVMGA